MAKTVRFSCDSCNAEIIPKLRAYTFDQAPAVIVTTQICVKGFVNEGHTVGNFSRDYEKLLCKKCYRASKTKNLRAV